jgi:hypothetical protein
LCRSRFIFPFKLLRRTPSTNLSRSIFGWYIYPQLDQSKFGASHYLSLHEVMNIAHIPELIHELIKISGWGLRGNMALYTIAKVLLHKSRNSRVCVSQSWN